MYRSKDRKDDDPLGSTGSCFLSFVILSVGYILNPAEIALSQSTTGLVTADAMAKAFGTSVMAKVIIVGGMCGIVTILELLFMIGGSRALYSMAESYMIPPVFAKLHPKHKTPVNALILIGVLTMIAPFAGRVMMVWICDAGNFGCCLAYCMVSISFLILRKKSLICQDHIVYRFTGLWELWQLFFLDAWFWYTVFLVPVEHWLCRSG